MAISIGPAPTNEWFQPGDTINFGYFEITSMTYAAGESADVYIITPKKIPAGMNLSDNITVLSVLKNGGENVGGTSLMRVGRRSDNVLSLSFHFPNNIGSYIFIKIAFSGTITFG